MRGAMFRPKAKQTLVNCILNIVKEKIVNKTFKILEKIEVFDIGLKSEGNFGVLFFGIGDIIARLKHTGNIPSTKHWLQIAVRGTPK